MEYSMKGNAVGIDLGATRIKGVLVGLASGEIIHQTVADTHDGNPNHWKQQVAGMVDRLANFSDTPIQGIGLAAPGIVSTCCGAIANMPGRMVGLEGVEWHALLGRPVKVLNDAHAALVAEACYGSAKGYRNALMLTLGTGVGGGLWLDGKLYQGHINRAGHMGHISIQADNPVRGITQTPGSLESAIGDATVASRTYNQYRNTKEMVTAYRQGEPIATLAWLSSLRQLAVGITSLVNTFSPEVVVLAGGIVNANEALFVPLEAFMAQFEWRPFGEAIPIRKAHFEDWSGAIGAAAYATTDF